VVYEKYDTVVLWRLKQYVSPIGNPSISDWRNGFPTARRKADFDIFLKLQVTLKNWVYPQFQALSGKHLKGLYELRWKSDGIPHRIGGYLGAPNEFVMLIGFTHNAKKYDPPTALEIILKRKKQVANGEAHLNEFQVVVGQRTSGQGIPPRIC
jgi:hypothetical protein